MLVRFRVISFQSVADMVLVMRKYALNDEINDPETVAKEYGSFLTAVERKSS